MTIGELAKAAQVGVETIRFYQRRGLLNLPPKPYGGIRRYAAADLSRLRFVRAAQRLGFSLDEVAELLRLDDGAHCVEASRLAERKLADVQARMADLARIGAALTGLVEACREGDGEVTCPLIAALYDERA